MLEKKGLNLFTKSINAVIWKTLEENKPELRYPCRSLVLKINALIGNSIFEGASGSRKKEIEDII